MTRTRGKRTIVALLILTVMVISMMPQTAMAATMVDIYRNNVLVEDVGGKLEGTKVVLPNYGALLTVLPELEGIVFPANREIILEDWARTAGVQYRRAGTRVDLTTANFNQEAFVEINGRRVYNADVIIDHAGEFILPQGATSARTIFTEEEVRRISNSTNAVALKFVAAQLGYEFRSEGRWVYLTGGETEAFIVLRGVRLYDTDVIIDRAGEFILPRGITSARTVFTRAELSGLPNSTEPVALKFVASRLGYEFRQEGNWAYITGSINYSELLFIQNDKAVTMTYTWENDKVMVTEAVLKRFFEEELKDIQLPGAARYDFTVYAEHFGYKVTRYQQYYWFRNDGRKPILVDIEGTVVRFPDQQPVIKDGRTLVPIAPIVSALGGSASWDGTKRLATIYVGRITVEIFIGQRTYYVDKRPLTMDVAAEIIGDRTMVPLRVTGDAVGYTSRWAPGTDIDWVHMTKN